MGEWLLSYPGDRDERALGLAVAEAVPGRPHLDWPEQDLAFAMRQATGPEHPTDDGFDASAAARSTAVGLLPTLTVEQVAELARRSARVAHGSEGAQAAAALHAAAVMHVVRGLDPTPELLLPTLNESSTRGTRTTGARPFPRPCCWWTRTATTPRR